MSGDDAVRMQQAIMAGTGYPVAGVADTPENQALWDEIAAAIENLPAGTVADLPHDWPEAGDPGD
jgi:hypothetical protein